MRLSLIMTAERKDEKDYGTGNIFIPCYPDVIFVVPLSLSLSLSFALPLPLFLWYVRSVLPGLYESIPLLQLSSHKAHMHLFLIK